MPTEAAMARDELTQAGRTRRELRYRTIFNGVQDAILVESLSGEILDVNDPACEMYGYPREAFIGKNVSELVASFSPTLRPRMAWPSWRGPAWARGWSRSGSGRSRSFSRLRPAVSGIA